MGTIRKAYETEVIRKAYQAAPTRPVLKVEPVDIGSGNGTQLTMHKRMFAMEYLVDLNGTQAAIRAGYSPASAESTSSRLLRDPKVVALINEHLAYRQKRLEITADKVLTELARIAFVDPAALFGEDGTMKPIHEVDEDTRRAISSVEVLERFDTKGEFIGYLKKVKFWSKEKASELLGKYLRLFLEERYATFVQAQNAQINVRRDIDFSALTSEELDLAISLGLKAQGREAN